MRKPLHFRLHEAHRRPLRILYRVMLRHCRELRAVNYFDRPDDPVVPPATLRFVHDHVRSEFRKHRSQMSASICRDLIVDAFKAETVLRAASEGCAASAAQICAFQQAEAARLAAEAGAAVPENAGRLLDRRGAAAARVRTRDAALVAWYKRHLASRGLLPEALAGRPVGGDATRAALHDVLYAEARAYVGEKRQRRRFFYARNAYTARVHTINSLVPITVLKGPWRQNEGVNASIRKKMRASQRAIDAGQNLDGLVYLAEQEDRWEAATGGGSSSPLTRRSLFQAGPDDAGVSWKQCMQTYGTAVHQSQLADARQRQVRDAAVLAQRLRWYTWNNSRRQRQLRAAWASLQ
ncbi:uncharacterized protein V1510DRAFT_423678 [Dipodascopsis tothii]|uniref:uncharacterized protein n=1 Tax=Dipodascopsis tothii TaxID=44089 RepID=UPI0034CE5A1E